MGRYEWRHFKCLHVDDELHASSAEYLQRPQDSASAGELGHKPAIEASPGDCGSIEGDVAGGEVPREYDACR